ncbi:MAG: hypothetical protein V3V00_01990 [Saprospiraceae bacterium]
MKKLTFLVTCFVFVMCMLKSSDVKADRYFTVFGDNWCYGSGCSLTTACCVGDEDIVITPGPVPEGN